MRTFTLLLLLYFSYAFGESTPIKKIITFPKAEFINENSIRIPLKKVDQLIVIEAELFNKKGNFIIDTGSETLILNSVHFQKNHTISEKNNKTSGVISLVDNPLEKHFKSFSINGLTWENKMGDILNLSHIEKTKKMKLLGIIGQSFLKDYEIFIDLYLNQITLSRVNNKGDKLTEKNYLEKIVDSIDFNLKGHTIVLNANVNGESLTFGLDTAAEFNQLNKRVNKNVLALFDIKKRVELTGVGNKTIEVLAGKLHRVKLSESIFFGPMLTVLTNLNNINEAFGTSIDGILGYEFFKQKRVIINYQKEMLYFIDKPLNITP
jgi:hypothetical protein